MRTIHSGGSQDSGEQEREHAGTLPGWEPGRDDPGVQGPGSGRRHERELPTRPMSSTRALCILPALLACACAHPPTKPDIFLISLDTTRADAISAWGMAPAGRRDLHGQVITPNLDALASSGVRYAWAFAHAPSTLASHATVFTGLDPHQLAIPRNGFPLLPGRETLAERLKADGWATTAVLGSSSLARPMGVDRGFDAWDETFSVTRRHRHEATATEVTDRAIAALNARPAGEPVFLFAHYYDAHGPYHAPGPGHFGAPTDPATITRLTAACRADGCESVEPEMEQVRGAYLDEVAYVDSEVGRLLAQPRGPAGRIVVVFGDHGELLGEEAKRPFGHGADVDPAATHVPLIFVAPGLAPGIVQTAVGLQDLAPTLLALAGDTRPFGAGIDLAGIVEGPQIPMEATQPGANAPGWNNRANEHGMVQGDEMVIEAPWLDEPARYQHVDGSAAPPDDPRAQTLHQGLLAWLADTPPFRAVQMDAATREGLKALGYVDE